MKKIGIWIPIIGLWYLWRNAMNDREEHIVGIHSFTIAAILQCPYTLIVIGGYLIANHRI